MVIKVGAYVSMVGVWALWYSGVMLFDYNYSVVEMGIILDFARNLCTYFGLCCGGVQYILLCDVGEI